MSSIHLSGVSKRFGATRVLDDLHLCVERAEHVGILGPSGIGKTTLLRIIAGLEYPDTGEVHLNGTLASTPHWLLEPHKRDVGLVFQSGALWPHMTVQRNIMFGLHSMGRDEANDRTQDLLDRAAISNLGGRYPDQLSAGQARRVALVRALAPRPRILLLDEPLVNVELELRDRLAAMIVSDTDTTGATVIHVTHDSSEARLIARRIVVMTQGRLSEPRSAT